MAVPSAAYYSTRTVAAVIPAYQAEATIEATVRGVRATGLEAIFVVDDGSTDATGTRAMRAGATVLRHRCNRGKGAALWTGFAAARALGVQAILTLDADGQHDPAEIPHLLEAHLRHPSALVVGARSLDSPAMPGRSRLGNRASTFFLRWFTGRPLTDSQSGYRVYPVALLERQPRTRHFDSETELLLAAVSDVRPVVEVPVQTIYKAGEKSHFRDGADVLRIIRLVLGWLATDRWRRLCELARSAGSP